jgi:protein-S-isoprenylcysteine O-methyltransferase Ste14
MNKLYIKAMLQLFIQFPIMIGVLIFLPAGTLNYWEAWVFISVLFICILALTIYLAIKDPELLERRMKAGPKAENEVRQKIIIVFMLLSMAAIVVLPAIDRRFEWSNVPASIVILGDLLIVLGFISFYFVLKENRYGAATIQIMEDQKVISTGPYALIRHPMYSGALIMISGIPLALGSWWGLLMLIPTVAVITWRLLDEEKFLHKNLPGYTEYTYKVRYRLVPYVW